ncbi:uncharacterized protein LOC117226856 isoform X1 [Megalopta genalis]|uniref:uncharacterized protein LOC117226856 isoform X1 n=1 Tax=Megalopta genalis TaxID=115081 RepID=UPI003FD27233
MDGSSGPPSDVTTAMGTENDEGSKVRVDANDTSISSSGTPSGTSATTATSYSTKQPEYCGQGLIRASSASPTLPTTSSSSSPSLSSASFVSFSASSSSSSSSLSSSPPLPGCGCVAATVLEPDEITISITPTTGGQFDLTVDRTDTIENLKKIISKRLKVAKERMCLLHRERLLQEGTLKENRLQDGSRLTLLPNVETGLLAQRPEQSVMQALESLNDSQVNDFLSGKAPLNLTMRLGDDMMLIQLQLSAVTQVSPTANQTTGNSTGLTIGSSNGSNLPSSHVSTSLQSRRSTLLTGRSASNASTKLQNGTSATRTSSLISSLVSAMHAAASLATATTTTSPVCSSRATTASSVSSSSSSSSSSSASYSAQSVNPTHSSFCGGQSQTGGRTGSNHGSASANGNTVACQSCLLYHHHNHHHHSHHHLYHHHHHHHHSRNKPAATNLNTTSQSSVTLDHTQQSTSAGQGCSDTMPYEITPPRKKLCTAHHHSQQSTSTTGDSSSRSNVDNGDSSPQSPTSTSLPKQSMKATVLDTRALAEASRNLTQRLKQLSSEVLTSRVDLAEENARRRHGIIIESMHHHGKSVYSGTFSGTLNPALQDRHGRPKRDINTIIHLLNDLLCVKPGTTAGYYRHHHRHNSGRQQSSSSPSSTGTTTTVNGTSTPIGCHDSSSSGYSTEELSKENEAMKGKMRRLRLVMDELRARKKARRQAKAAPYTTQWSTVTPDPDPNTSSTATTSTADPSNEPELQPCSPEPVVA